MSIINIKREACLKRTAFDNIYIHNDVFRITYKGRIYEGMCTGLINNITNGHLICGHRVEFKGDNIIFGDRLTVSPVAVDTPVVVDTPVETPVEIPIVFAECLCGSAKELSIQNNMVILFRNSCYWETKLTSSTRTFLSNCSICRCNLYGGSTDTIIFAYRDKDGIKNKLTFTKVTPSVTPSVIPSVTSVVIPSVTPSVRHKVNDGALKIGEMEKDILTSRGFTYIDIGKDLIEALFEACQSYMSFKSMNSILRRCGLTPSEFLSLKFMQHALDIGISADQVSITLMSILEQRFGKTDSVHNLDPNWDVSHLATLVQGMHLQYIDILKEHAVTTDRGIFSCDELVIIANELKQILTIVPAANDVRLFMIYLLTNDDPVSTTFAKEFAAFIVI